MHHIKNIKIRNENKKLNLKKWNNRLLKPYLPNTKNMILIKSSLNYILVNINIKTGSL